MRIGQLLGPELKELLKEDPEQVRGLLDEIHPEDLADVVGELDHEEAAKLLERLPAEEAAPIFERLDETEQEELAHTMPPMSMARIASEMEPDDRADLFSGLRNDLGEMLLKTLETVDPEAAQEVREIEKWPETSAGHLMTTKYLAVPPDFTVGDALAAVKAFVLRDDSPIYNVYAMRSEHQLLGLVSIRELIAYEPEQRLSDVYRENVITVPPELDQEEVARRMAKYDLNVVPVVTDKGVMLGVITIDDVIDVLTQEQTEDVQKIGGVQPLDVPYFQTSFVDFIRKRGVWLVVLFLGEFFTQTALRYYDPVFEAIKGASYYVPLLISAGGNSGSQSSTLIIRGLAIGEVTARDWFRIFVRELGMGVVLGLMLGTIGFVRVLMYADSHLDFAITIGATLVGIVAAGSTVGAMVPLVLKSLGVDPATSSTPFIASLVDVIGIVVFVQIAKIVMASVIASHSGAPAAIH